MDKRLAVVIGIVGAVLIILGVYQIITGLRGGGVQPSSFDIKLDITSQGMTTSVRLRADGVDTASPNVRGDTLSGEAAGTSFIINIGAGKVYAYAGGQWSDQTETQEGQALLEGYPSAVQSFSSYLSGWTSGDISYEYQDVSYRIYDISVNMAIDASVFQPA